MAKEDLNKRILPKNKISFSKTSITYGIISLIIFCGAIFYTSSQIKYLVVTGNKFIINGKSKTIVEKKYDFDSFEKLEKLKKFD